MESVSHKVKSEVEALISTIKRAREEKSLNEYALLVKSLVRLSEAYKNIEHIKMKKGN